MIKASIVIPFYNDHHHLDDCLASLRSLPQDSYEIIIVDDASATPLAPLKDIQIIRHATNLGPAASRNTGLKKTSCDCVLFIDSDVIVTSEDIEKVVDLFLHDEVSAFTTGHSSSHPKGQNINFFTFYKTLYMHQVMGHSFEQVSFLYGSFCGVKKRLLGQHQWPEHLRYGEDTCFATLLSNDGHRIGHYKEIELSHLKTYSFFSLLKNDFLIPFHFAKSYLAQKNRQGLKFSHARTDQLFAIACVPFMPVSLFLWLYYNRHLFRVTRRLGLLQAVLFTYIDQLVMGLGIFTGLLYYKFMAGKITYKNASFHKSQDLDYS